MSIFTRFFGRGETPATKAFTTLDLMRVMAEDGGSVTPNSSLQSIAVLRCVTLLSGLHASFPLDVNRKVKGKRLSVENHPLDQIFNSISNPEQDAFQFKQMMMVNLLLSGNACAIITRSGDRIVALQPVPWDTITWKREDGKIEYKIGETPYADDQIFRVSLLSLDGLHGLSPIQQTRARLAGHIQAENQQGRLYANKPFPGMVISYTSEVTEAKVKQLRDGLKDGFTGENAGRPMILGGGPSVLFPTIPMSDLQWLESLGYGEEQIARLYGIPPVVLGITAKSTSWGTGIEQQNIGFAQYTLIPNAVMWEMAIKRQLMTPNERSSGMYVKHNLASMLRGDSKTQSETVTTYIQGGVLNPNEGRAFLDLDPYDGGEKYVMQAQMTPVDLLGKTPTAPNPIAGGAKQ